MNENQRCVNRFLTCTFGKEKIGILKSVKTYHLVDSKNDHRSFAVSRMEDIYQERSGAPDEPHRHDFYTVLIVEKGNGIHKIDFNTYKIEKHEVFFVAPGQVHQVIEKEMSKGFVLTFSRDFLVQNYIPLSFIDSLNLFQDYGQSPPLMPEQDQFEKLKQYSEEIFELFKSEKNLKLYSIAAFLKLLLIECNNICTLDPEDSYSDTSENSVVRRFKENVNQEYRKEHSTTFYAKQLHITPDHLNRLIKRAIGKTAKEYIQSRIITEAKRLLYFSGLSAKEIGFKLGFSEPSNFSAFFKKCTGYSPSKFLQNEG